MRYPLRVGCDDRIVHPGFNGGGRAGVSCCMRAWRRRKPAMGTLGCPLHVGCDARPVRPDCNPAARHQDVVTCLHGDTDNPLATSFLSVMGSKEQVVRTTAGRWRRSSSGSVRRTTVCCRPAADADASACGMSVASASERMPSITSSCGGGLCVLGLSGSYPTLHCALLRPGARWPLGLGEEGVPCRGERLWLSLMQPSCAPSLTHRQSI